MTRTQIQLPDDLYRRAKELAADREISLAELVRNGLEYMLTALTPPGGAKTAGPLPELKERSVPDDTYAGWTTSAWGRAAETPDARPKKGPRA